MVKRKKGNQGKRKKPELILGFVGPFCAGKGEAINYLVSQKGFYASSTSDRIREEILSKGGKITRDNLQKTGGLLRERFGPEVLAKRTWEKILESGATRAAVDSIRSQGEVEFLQKIPGFYLVAVLADPKLRFQRMSARMRESDDPQTFEEFLKTEERDKKAEGRNVDACLAMADFRVENKGTLAELYQQLEKILEKLS